jgi:hypothetical protein
MNTVHFSKFSDLVNQVSARTNHEDSRVGMMICTPVNTLDKLCMKHA